MASLNITSTVHDYLHLVPGYEEFETYSLNALNTLKQAVDDACSTLERWQIIVITIAMVFAVQKLYAFFYRGQGAFHKTKQIFFTYLRKLPFVRKRIEAEIATTARSIQASVNGDLKPGMTFLKKLPVRGMTQEQICTLAAEYKSMGKYDLHRGRASGTLYNGANDLTLLNAEIYKMFAWSNPLHGDIYPDIRKMEAEVVQMCVAMFNGGPDACGTMTSGGTESIMLACKAYKDRAVSRGIKYPEMLAPKSAHAAFEKACDTLDIVFRTVPADPLTMKVDVKAMRRMINRNTCMLVGSCPDFPMGVIDPIEEISELGIKYDIPVHVDACLGGFLVAFMDKAGFPLPLFDFRVRGVTSISCDTHKYAFAPKGSSVVLYRNRALRRHQFYVITDWPGGIYATPTFAGSRPGAIIAACWATMMYYGEDGYVETTKKIITVARYIKENLKNINGIFVFGDPLVSVITIGSLDFDVLRLSAALTERGWSLNALQFPSSFHFCCTLRHTQPGVADEFLEDVRECTAEIMSKPKEKASGMAAIYGLSQSIPDRSLVSELVMEYLDAFYNTSASPKSELNGLSNRH